MKPHHKSTGLVVLLLLKMIVNNAQPTSMADSASRPAIVILCNLHCFTESLVLERTTYNNH